MGRAPKGEPPSDLDAMANKLAEPRPGYTTLKYTARTITPYIGGSAVLGETSPTARPSAVANSIRRWWRICQADKYATAHELWKAESDLWGSAEKVGRVTVVTKSKEGSEASIGVKRKINRETGKLVVDRLDPFPTLPPYAVFPWAVEKVLAVNNNAIPIRTDLEFSIEIICPKETECEIVEAVKTYNLFGGYGQRTNRGLGSLRIQDANKNDLALPGHHRRGRSGFTGTPAQIFKKPANSENQAWKTAVGVYRNFRQAPGYARDGNPGDRIPGKSLYPEADMARKVSGRVDHSVLVDYDAYPRADLGLPIILHFIADGEPPDMTIEGASDGHRRFESPVITKATYIGGQLFSMVALLDSPHVWESGNTARIKSKYTTEPILNDQLNVPQDTLNKIDPLDGNAARDAMEHYLTANGWNSEAL